MHHLAVGKQVVQSYFSITITPMYSIRCIFYYSVHIYLTTNRIISEQYYHQVMLSKIAPIAQGLGWMTCDIKVISLKHDASGYWATHILCTQKIKWIPVGAVRALLSSDQQCHAMILCGCYVVSLNSNQQNTVRLYYYISIRYDCLCVYIGDKLFFVYLAFVTMKPLINHFLYGGGRSQSHQLFLGCYDAAGIYCSCKNY